LTAGDFLMSLSEIMLSSTPGMFFSTDPLTEVLNSTLIMAFEVARC
jgi:hypothetical protein